MAEVTEVEKRDLSGWAGDQSEDLEVEDITTPASGPEPVGITPITTSKSTR